MLFKLVILLLPACLKLSFSSGKPKIFISCLFPGYGVDYYGYKAAIELATDLINNRSDILPDHEIVVMCNDTYGLVKRLTRDVFANQFKTSENVRLLLGPAFSDTAKAAYYAYAGKDGIVQLSYVQNSAEFASYKYNGLFTNVPSTSAFNSARLCFMQRFGWKRIAILHDCDDKDNNMAVRNLQYQITRDKLNISLITVQAFNKYNEGQLKLQLENLRKLDAHIIIGELSTGGVVRVLCEAHKMGMLGPKYVWLLSLELLGSKLSNETFQRSYRDGHDCNFRQIIEAADRGITFQRLLIRQDNRTTLSGLTPETFINHLDRRKIFYKPRNETSYAFDCVWAAALLLHRRYLENASAMSQDVNHYASLLSETQFQGMSGPHKFKDRQRMGTVIIRQIRLRDGTAKLFDIGTHDTATKKLMLNDEGEKKNLWKDGKVPSDTTPKEHIFLAYSQEQFITIFVFAVLGLIYSLALLYFNISKRSHKVVQMSSPMINNVILLCCFLCYVYVLLLGIVAKIEDDYVFGILCKVRLYILSIAFSLAFGALFSKTWRVHKIFTAQRAIKKKMLRDIHLILFVLVLVIIDVVFITVWNHHDPVKPKDVVFDKLGEYSGDLITVRLIKVCESTYQIELLYALYGYKGMFLLFGAFLACATRNVTIPALNDSKYIGMSIYNVVILSAIGVTGSMVLHNPVYFKLLHILVSVVVLLATSFTLSMVFLPKVYQYYHTPSEGQTRTLETLEMNARNTAADSAFYEAYVKRKDVKHEWIQTENFEEVSCDDGIPEENGEMSAAINFNDSGNDDLPSDK